MKMRPFAVSLVGLVVLTGTVLVTGWIGGVFSRQTDAPVPSPAADTGVACFGYVDLEYGVTALSPVQTGRVVEVLVRENDAVPAGKVLLVLDAKRARLRVMEAEARFEAAQAALLQAEKLPEQHRSKTSQQREAIEAIGHRLAAARHVLDRKRELEKTKSVNSREVAAAEEQAKELEAGQRAEKEKLVELQSHDPALDVRRVAAELALCRVRLDEARYGLEECSLKAPREGTVLRVLTAPGDVLGEHSRQPAIMFCPSTPRLLRAEVEQEFAGRVRVGQLATAQDEASGAGTWRGRVVRIADWFAQRRLLLQEPFQYSDVRTVECLIELAPGQPALRIGQRMRVTIGGPMP